MKRKTIELREGRHDVKLTCYTTRPDSLSINNDKRPAVLILPGGGYFNCDKESSEGDPVAMSFVADGYQAFVLQYSVITTSQKGEAAFPAQLLDVAKAMLTIRENAEDWFTDPDKITLIGFSAGGHLSAMYSTVWHDPLFINNYGGEYEWYRPVACISVYGIHDYRLALKKQLEEQNPKDPVYQRQSMLFGEITEEKLTQYSPICRATDKTPPMFLVAATDDDVVNPANTLLMANRLRELGVPYELHMFRHGGHGFGVGTNIDMPYRKDLSHCAANWLAMAKDFLLNILYPETAVKEENVFGIRMADFFKNIGKH